MKQIVVACGSTMQNAISAPKVGRSFSRSDFSFMSVDRRYMGREGD